MHAAYIAAPVLAALAVLLVALNAGATIARLMARLGADPVGQVLGGAATVGVLGLLLAVTLLGQHTPTRALALIYLVAWLPLSIALSAAEAALSAGLATTALAQVGQTLATLLVGRAAVTAYALRRDMSAGRVYHAVVPAARAVIAAWQIGRAHV